LPDGLDILGAISSWISDIYHSLKSYVYSLVKTYISPIWDALKNVYKFVADYVKKAVAPLWDAIKGVLETAKKLVDSAVASLKHTIDSVRASIMGYVEKQISNVYQAIHHVSDEIRGWVTSQINQLKEWVIQQIEAYTNAVWQTIMENEAEWESALADAMQAYAAKQAEDINMYIRNILEKHGVR